MADRRHDTVFNTSAAGTLGDDVRRVREARKISQRALAHAVGYSVSYVSQVESGKIMPSERFVQGCDKAFGTGDLFARQRHRLVHGEHPSWFVPQVHAEGRAEVIEDFSTVFIYGLLQTPEYARSALEMGVPVADPDGLDAKVAGRMKRRAILEAEHPPRTSVLLHEACLHACIGTSRIMAEQLVFLAESVSRYASLTLQVLPFGAAAAAVGTPFTLLGFKEERPAVYAEGPRGGRLYEDAPTVANSREIYDRLRACALSPKESIACISGMRGEHERNARMDQVELLGRSRGKLRRVGAGSRVRRGRRPGQGQ